MSHNLHFTVNGCPVDIWQTPTYITEMCLYSKAHKKGDVVTGKAAHRALALYSIWGKNHDFNWSLPEELMNLTKDDELIAYMS